MRTPPVILVAAGALLGGAVALVSAATLAPATPTLAPVSQDSGAGAGQLTEQQVQTDTYAAMTQLSKLIGRWDVSGQSFEPDGTAAETFNGSAVFGLALGENFVQGEWSLQSGPYVLEQVDYFGYSPGLRRFTHVMLTQLDKSMVYQQGVWIPESNTLSFTMAAPLDTPRGTPRAVGLEYGWLPDGRIAVTMTMNSGAQPARTVRMMMTPSQEPPAPTGPEGMPLGGVSALRGTDGTPANMAQMQKALAQMSAQKQAMQQYMTNMHKQVRQMSQQMTDLAQ